MKIGHQRALDPNWWLLPLLVTACGPMEIDRLVCCDTGPADHQSILFLMESGHVPAMVDSSSLRTYLLPAEFGHAFDSVSRNGVPGSDPTWIRRIKYGHLQEVLYDTLGFTAELILIDSLPCLDRDYRFQLRTYDASHAVIDTLTYAMWSACLGRWCSGRAYENLFVERQWHDSITEQFSISVEGRFIKIE